MDRLDAIISFVRAVESGSFVAAARSLGLSAPMIGRSLDRFPDMTVDLRLNDHRVDLIADHRSQRTVLFNSDSRSVQGK